VICENCKKEHDGSFGAGIFCSEECAIDDRNKILEKENKNKLKVLFHYYYNKPRAKQFQEYINELSIEERNKIERWK